MGLCEFFVITLESIASINRMIIGGVKILTNTKMSFKGALKYFCEPTKKIPWLHHVFNKKTMEGILQALVKVLIQFVTYEGRYKRFHSHIS